jgi:hypothetical protein
MKAIPTTTKRRRRRRKPVTEKPAKLRIQRNYDPASVEVGQALAQMNAFQAQDLKKKFYRAFAELASLSNCAPAEAAAIYRSIGKTILDLAEHAETVPEEVETAVRELISKCHLFHRKWKATPNRKEVRARAFFRQTANAAFWEVAVLHDAGWRRHWSIAREFPECPLGSPDPKHYQMWNSWFATFFPAEIDRCGISGRPGTKAGAGIGRGRNIVLQKVFDYLYGLPHFKEMTHVMRMSLDRNCEVHGTEGGTTFLECMAHAHPECVNIS